MSVRSSGHLIFQMLFAILAVPAAIKVILQTLQMMFIGIIYILLAGKIHTTDIRSVFSKFNNNKRNLLLLTTAISKLFNPLKKICRKSKTLRLVRCLLTVMFDCIIELSINLRDHRFVQKGKSEAESEDFINPPGAN